MGGHPSERGLRARAYPGQRSYKATVIRKIEALGQSGDIGKRGQSSSRCPTASWLLLTAVASSPGTMVAPILPSRPVRCVAPFLGPRVLSAVTDFEADGGRVGVGRRRPL